MLSFKRNLFSKDDILFPTVGLPWDSSPPPPGLTYADVTTRIYRLLDLLVNGAPLAHQLRLQETKRLNTDLACTAPSCITKESVSVKHQDAFHFSNLPICITLFLKPSRHSQLMRNRAFCFISKIRVKIGLFRVVFCLS